VKCVHGSLGQNADPWSRLLEVIPNSSPFSVYFTQQKEDKTLIACIGAQAPDVRPCVVILCKTSIMISSQPLNNFPSVFDSSAPIHTAASSLSRGVHTREQSIRWALLSTLHTRVAIAGRPVGHCTAPPQLPDCTQRRTAYFRL
jgi:hypothetical protein